MNYSIRTESGAQPVDYVEVENTLAEEDFEVAHDCCYVIFKDQKHVVLYSNDANDTTGQPFNSVMDPAENPEIIDMVEGLKLLFCWTGDENISQTKFTVTTIIVAYNFNYGQCDRVNQKCASCPTPQKEKRVSMSIFSLIVDNACLNKSTMRDKVTFMDQIELSELNGAWQLILLYHYSSIMGQKRESNMYCKVINKEDS